MAFDSFLLLDLPRSRHPSDHDVRISLVRRPKRKRWGINPRRRIIMKNMVGALSAEIKKLNKSKLSVGGASPPLLVKNSSPVNWPGGVRGYTQGHIREG
jgi:hypothetical protein